MLMSSSPSTRHTNYNISMQQKWPFTEELGEISIFRFENLHSSTTRTPSRKFTKYHAHCLSLTNHPPIR